MTLDNETISKLQHLQEHLELCDQRGHILGYFVPAVDKVKYSGIDGEVSEAELERREATESGRPLADILCNDQILDIADALGGAGCLDASIGGHPDGIEAVFNREAMSWGTAIKSAITAIENAGFKVHRVELPRETINLAEIGS